MRRVNENNLKKESWILKFDGYNSPNYLKVFGEYVVKLRTSTFKRKNGIKRFCVGMRIFDITEGYEIARFNNIKCMETIDIIVNFLKQQQIVEYKHDDIINNGYTKLFEYEYAKVFKKGLGISIDIEEKQFIIRRSWKYELKVNKQFNFSAMEKLLELCEDDYHQYRNN